jgi:P27 family predicted phage terminase small subunit
MKKTTPKPPTHLSAAAKALWLRLFNDYALEDAAGLLLLQSACEAYDRLQEARRILDKEGAIVKDRWQQAKPHPATGVERDARNQMHGALRLMKLSPGDAGEEP